MNVSISKRFRLRTMLVVVAVIAVVIIVGRDSVRLREARELYRRSNTSWLALRIRLEDLVAASERFTSDEADSMWISRRLADGQHVERMKELVKRLDRGRGVWESMPDEIKRRRICVVDSIRKYKPDYMPPVEEE